MPTGRRVSKRAACGSVFGNPDDASGPGRAQGCLRAVSDTGFEVEHGLATRRKLAIDLLESVVTACSEHQGVAPLSAPNPVASPMPLEETVMTMTRWWMGLNRTSVSRPSSMQGD